MARILAAQGRTKLTVIIVALVIVILAVVVFAIVQHNNVKRPVSVVKDATNQVASKDTTTETDAADTATPVTTPSTPDPSTLSTIAVDALGVTVAYTKGTPSFEYSVEKTDDNTQYAEFTAADLVGTKCTDDQGLFASIIKNPTSTEDQTTIAQTVKIGSDTYGLSLASPGCTANTDLLSQYQSGFKDGFSSLKAL